MDAKDALNEDTGEAKSPPSVDLKEISIGELLASLRRLSIGSTLFLICLLGIIFSVGFLAHVMDGTESSQSGSVSDDTLRRVEEYLEGLDPLFQEDMADLLAEKGKILDRQANLIIAYRSLSEEPNISSHSRSLYSHMVDSLAQAFGFGGSSPTEIHLQKGWNTVGYFGRPNISPNEAFAGIMEILSVVKNGRGQIFMSIPDESLFIDQIRSLIPGKAYRIYVERDTVFTFPI